MGGAGGGEERGGRWVSWLGGIGVLRVGRFVGYWLWYGASYVSERCGIGSVFEIAPSFLESQNPPNRELPDHGAKF